ncbi:hypothetical protein HWV62_17430 [Athelia sp. TMB]|nr:hypothetical protein HWV62_17430 [Athelia sp. TMB]
MPSSYKVPQQATIHGDARRDQVRLQGHLGRVQGEAGRQPAHEPPGAPFLLLLPPPFFMAAMLMDVDGQGVYVLQYNAFKPLARLSSWDGRADALHKAKLTARISLKYALSPPSYRLASNQMLFLGHIPCLGIVRLDSPC